MHARLVILLALLGVRAAFLNASESLIPAPVPTVALRLATFDVDATPPVGSMLAYDLATNHWDLGLRARGVVLLGAGEPIVLCAVDWIGIANEGHDRFCAALARAAATSPHRVAVHTLHQHDAPDCDFSAERILQEAGLAPQQFEGRFQRQLLADLEKAVRDSLARARPVTHLGLGEARVDRVASNRRILGPDGKARATRWTASKDAAIRAEPEGVIDPIVSLVSFWEGEQPMAVLSYYATHPQSYYRTGVPNPDFPGLARFFRQLAVPAALHVHFNGASGNVGAGKYNDGSPENRLALAERLADGMRRAWDSTKRQPIVAADVTWNFAAVALPPAQHLDAAKLEAYMKERLGETVGAGSASQLAWLRRCQSGLQLEVQCLGLNRARILHLPGESFIEYQLAAKARRPDRFVAVAAYGDYAPWYIGTKDAYEQGGYETSPNSSNVGPESESVLMGAIRQLLSTAQP
jgi:hypothetical protein